MPFLKWLGALPWKDIISVVFSATGIGIAVVTLRSANERNKQEARSKRVAEFIDRCQRFVQGYMDFANSQRKVVLALTALNIQLQSLSLGASLLEVMNKELHGIANPLEGRFKRFTETMLSLFSEYFTLYQNVEHSFIPNDIPARRETAFLEYQAKVGFQAESLMNRIREYIVQGRLGTPADVEIKK